MPREIAIEQFGTAASASSLRLRDSAARPPADDEVAIDVAYSGVNFADIQMRLGFYPDAPPARSCPATRSAARSPRSARP